jgi:gluconate 5-dehydrogenase
MLAKFDLSGKTAIVTGGAGGIGRILAQGLAECGADILVADRQFEGFERVADRVRETGRRIQTVSVDITNEESVDEMIKQAMEEYSRIDILVNAAGTVFREATESLPADEWQKVMDVNVRGVFLTCRAAGRVMIERGGGKIVNISSVKGRYGGSKGDVSYCSSKGAVDNLTRTLACEWAKKNVFVNAIAPAVVETELTRAIFENPEDTKKLQDRIPLGRWAVADDIVGPVIFLASSASDFITGQIIYVDGGMTAQS